MRRLVKSNAEHTPAEAAVEQLVRLKGLRLVCVAYQPGRYQLLNVYSRPSQRRLDERRKSFSLTEIEDLVSSNRWKRNHL